MEKPIYPSPYMRITQGYNIGTHQDSYAIDEAGKDQGISLIRAPFTGIIKKIYLQDANEVWLESIEPVEYPDGTMDYMTIMFAHANDVSNLFVGKKIGQGESFYSEGTKGNATGNHCHIECGQGRFTNTGWHKNNSGYYSINNGKRPEECLWIDDSVTIINDNGYNFQKLQNNNQQEEVENDNSQSEEDENIKQDQEKEVPDADKNIENPQNTVENIHSNSQQLIFTCEKDDLYGIYLKKGQKLYLQ